MKATLLLQLLDYLLLIFDLISKSICIRFRSESELFYSDLVNFSQYRSLYFISYYLSLDICTNLGVGVTLAGTALVSKLSVYSLFSVFGLQIAGAHTNSIVELSLYNYMSFVIYVFLIIWEIIFIVFFCVRWFVLFKKVLEPIVCVSLQSRYVSLLIFRDILYFWYRIYYFFLGNLKLDL